MPRWIGAGLCLAGWVALPAAPDDTAPADFSRYQAILDRQPFGEIAPPEAAPPDGEVAAAAAASAALTDFELKAIIDEGGALQAGFLDKRTSKHVYLGVGQMLDGLELVSLNYEAEEAVLQRESETVVLKLRPAQPEDGAAAPEAAAEAAPAERAVPFGLSETGSGGRRPFFSERRRRPFSPFQPDGTNMPFQPRSLESFFRPVTNGAPPFVSPFRPVSEPGAPAVAPGFPFVPVPAAEVETPDAAPAPAFPLPQPEGGGKEDAGGDAAPAPDPG